MCKKWISSALLVRSEYGFEGHLTSAGSCLTSSCLALLVLVTPFHAEMPFETFNYRVSGSKQLISLQETRSNNSNYPS